MGQQVWVGHMVMSRGSNGSTSLDGSYGHGTWVKWVNKSVWVIWSWVVGQTGHHIWMGHVGHASCDPRDPLTDD